MKNIILVCMVTAASVCTTPYASEPETVQMSKGDIARGHKLFKKLLREKCGFTGTEMSKLHTQDEWRRIYQTGRLEEEIKKQCPNVKDVKDKYLIDLYEYFHHFGSDSGNVPFGNLVCEN